MTRRIVDRPVGLWLDDKHRYYYGDLGPLISVTTATGIINKPDLNEWRPWEVASCAVRNAGILPNIIAEKGEKGATGWLKSIPDIKREVKADLGTRVHKLAERIIAGETPDCTDDEKPYVYHFQEFLSDMQPKYLHVETQVCHLGLLYGGTFDGIADIAGDRYLLDIKTSKSVFPEVALQLAAYCYADFIGHKDSAEQTPLPAVDRCAVIHLRPDGYSLIDFDGKKMPAIDSTTFEAFKHALGLYRWMKGAA